jgi:hypothetical protein
MTPIGFRKRSFKILAKKKKKHIYEKINTEVEVFYMNLKEQILLNEADKEKFNYYKNLIETYTSSDFVNKLLESMQKNNIPIQH